MTMRNGTRAGSNYVSALALIVALTFLELLDETSTTGDNLDYIHKFDIQELTGTLIRRKK